MADNTLPGYIRDEDKSVFAKDYYKSGYGMGMEEVKGAVCLSLISPIPLTEEWLKRFGFRALLTK